MGRIVVCILVALVSGGCEIYAGTPAEGRFERTLNVSGPVNVEIRTRSGGIRVYTSPANARDLFVDGGIAAGKKKSTDKMNVFYTPYRPRIIQSVETQNHDAGLVDLLYDNGARFIIQYLNVENVVIAKL